MSAGISGIGVLRDGFVASQFPAGDERVDLGGDLVRERDDAPHAAVEFDGALAVGGESHVFDHLACVHLYSEHAAHLAGELVQALFGEGPQGDGTQQPDLQAAGPGVGHRGLADTTHGAECHDEQVEQFSKGKHSHGWGAMWAIPATAMEPSELMAGGKGCGGCHNMGLKSEVERKERQEKGYRYNNNSCDECHTRHAFDKREAMDPKACQQCHMGYDHPQYEMWSSSKHGTRYFVREKGKLP